MPFLIVNTARYPQTDSELVSFMNEVVSLNQLWCAGTTPTMVLDQRPHGPAIDAFNALRQGAAT
jgi:hypothetical protein